MRIFISINLPENVKNHIWSFSQNLQQLYKHHKITWVARQALHITLEFLGNLNKTEINLVKKILQEKLQKIQSREIIIEFNEFTAFPSSHKPRALIIKGFGKSKLNIKDIQRNIHNALINRGFDLDNKIWHLHITLGRIKNRGIRLNFDKSHTFCLKSAPRFKQNIRQKVRNKINFNPVSFKVGSVNLMSSKLTPEGSIYSVIERYNI